MVYEQCLCHGAALHGIRSGGSWFKYGDTRRLHFQDEGEVKVEKTR
jgi:hypothetical protein